MNMIALGLLGGGIAYSLWEPSVAPRLAAVIFMILAVGVVLGFVSIPVTVAQ